MSKVTDDYMREMLSRAKPYTIVILRKTPRAGQGGIDGIIWEHGRRNFELRNAGKLNIVCPVRDETEVGGVAIFSTDPGETKRIMDGDPAVIAGILKYEIHATIGIPGSMLP